MIKLNVEYYCQNCPYFNPISNRLETFDMSYTNTNTYVECSDRLKCEAIHNQLKKEIETLKEGGGDDKCSS